MHQSTPIDDPYTAVGLELVRQSVRAGGATRLPVSGTSMLPLLRPDDAVWLESIATAMLQPGDLIVVRQHDVLLAHRLIAVGPAGWQTKGDNNRLVDPIVAAEAIQGRIVTLERGGTLITMRRHWLLVNRLLAHIGRLEQRCQELLHPKLRWLTYIVDASFRFLIQAIVAAAVRF